jgi:hypothetical protein
MHSSASEENLLDLDARARCTRAGKKYRAAVLNTPLGVPLATLSGPDAAGTRISRDCFAGHGDGSLTIA